MPTPAELWQDQQRQIADATAAAVLAVWERVRLAAPQRSFEAALPELVGTVTAGQLVAASGAPEYVAAAVLTEGVRPDPVATVDPRRFAGLTSDGRTLTGLLTQPLLRTLYLRTQGADDRTALMGGRLSLETLVRTEVLDTGRDATATAAALDRQVAGYIRQVRMPACDRCVILAGRFYRRNEGFLRHPRCDCVHQIVTEVSEPQNPRALFEQMTPEQQDRAFGKANAEVIRRGGDISQVVNARRGMASAGSNWTSEGTTKRGAYGRSNERPRPSPGALLRFAKDPDEFAKALSRARYL